MLVPRLAREPVPAVTGRAPRLEESARSPALLGWRNLLFRAAL